MPKPPTDEQMLAAEEFIDRIIATNMRHGMGRPLESARAQAIIEVAKHTARMVEALKILPEGGPKTRSADLQPGTKLRYRNTPEIVVLDRRKTPEDDRYRLPFHPGWWLAGTTSGLADFVIDDPDSGWEVIEDA
jgi:hypothetical protein